MKNFIMKNIFFVIFILFTQVVKAQELPSRINENGDRYVATNSTEHVPKDALIGNEKLANSVLRIGPTFERIWTSNAPGTIQVAGYSLGVGNNEALGMYKGFTITDSQSSPTQLRLGGQQEYDSVPINEHCFPYGGGNMGTCAQFMLGSQNVQGQAAGIGPSNAAQIPNYDNFDVANTVTQGEGATPYFTATSNLASNVMPVPSDGLDHTPFFTETGAIFANPLPLDVSKWILSHPLLRMMTNEVGCSTCAIPVYVGIMQSATINSRGQVTSITTDGWRVFESKDNTANQVPGKTTTDGSFPSLDTTWTKFGYPALMFGIYTKIFNNYSLCSTQGPTPISSAGDVNYPTGNRNNQVRNCIVQEADLWNYDPTGTSKVQGVNVIFSKMDKASDKPAMGSFNFNSAGANLVGYQATGEYFTQPFSSSSFRVAGYGGPTYGVGDTQVVADWSTCNRAGYECDGSWLRYTIRPTIWNTRNVATSTSSAAQSYSDITTNLGVQINGNTDAGTTPSMDGILQEHIEFNPKSNHTGIGFCNYNQTDTNCSLIVSYNGIIISNKGADFVNYSNIKIKGGKLEIEDENGNFGGWIQSKKIFNKTKSSTINEIDIDFLSKSSGTLKVHGKIISTQLSGRGNAYACINASGQIYRSTIPCN